MRRDDQALWARVTATVRPLHHDAPPAAAVSELRPGLPAPPASPRHPARPPQPLEPRRLHRIAKGRDEIAARIDLHGLTYDQARGALIGFLTRVRAHGGRAALVITGKGVMGDGVLRRAVPDWLGQAPLAPIVAGYHEAHRRHGGAGALYVALKR
jgi:DNA-nicking Smr family endonuclease